MTQTKVQTLSKELFEQKTNPNLALFKLRGAINETIASNKCAWCNSKNIKFRDEMSLREYQISALCQDCQDKTFGKAVEHEDF